MPNTHDSLQSIDVSWYVGDFYIADYYFDEEVMDYQTNAILNYAVGNQDGLISLGMIINLATICALHQMMARWMFEMQMGRDAPSLDPDVGITLQRGAQVRLASHILTRIIYRKHLDRRGNWIIPPTKSNADRFARELKDEVFSARPSLRHNLYEPCFTPGPALFPYEAWRPDSLTRHAGISRKIGVYGAREVSLVPMTDVSAITPRENGLRRMKYILEIGDYNKRAALKNWKRMPATNRLNKINTQGTIFKKNWEDDGKTARFWLYKNTTSPHLKEYEQKRKTIEQRDMPNKSARVVLDVDQDLRASPICSFRWKQCFA